MKSPICIARHCGRVLPPAARSAPYIISISTRGRTGLPEIADRLFADHDALITLSAPTEATRLEDGPGSGVMSMPWSLCGLPTVSLPLLRGHHGLPIGIQLIGTRGRDRDLLRIASWLELIFNQEHCGEKI